jgi:hypothetical protein
MIDDDPDNTSPGRPSAFFASFADRGGVHRGNLRQRVSKLEYRLDVYERRATAAVIVVVLLVAFAGLWIASGSLLQ